MNYREPPPVKSWTITVTFHGRVSCCTQIFEGVRAHCADKAIEVFSSAFRAEHGFVPRDIRDVRESTAVEA